MTDKQSNARRVALVFGGSRGIGAAIAERLARDGFDVALTYVSRPDAAQAVVGAIEAAGQRGLAIQADSADPAAIRAAVDQAVGQLGTLDAVVVNAGVLRIATVDAFTLADLDLSLNVNVRGVFLAIQAAVAQLRDGGRVITIGSNTAIRTGSPGSSVYAMTKAAVAAMVQNLALDLAPRGITVNNVQPGPIATDMTAPFAEYLGPKLPLGRMGQPREIGALVSYLAGPESGYMTGASLTIDGGFVL
ncbi:MAG: SDR family oxidoreductase [Burkholderiaceae bacterium]